MLKELAEVLGSLFRKISDIFDVFDLSFVVSGAVSLGALWFWFFPQPERAVSQLKALTGEPSGFIAVVLGSYVTGLICFASGRVIRKVIRSCLDVATRLLPFLGRSGGPNGKPRSWTSSPVEELLSDALKAHGLLDEEQVKRYGSQEGLSRLYVRLWAKLRETPSLATSFTLIKRYWVMAAAYDGLGSAGVLWMGVLVARRDDLNPDLQDALFVMAVLLLGVAACFIESSRLVRYQVEEIVATLALVDRKTRLRWISPDVLKTAPFEEDPVIVPKTSLPAVAAPAEPGPNVAQPAPSDPLRSTPPR